MRHHLGVMAQPSIHDFHVHLYFDPGEIAQARALAAALAETFDLPIGHFHTRPVGPHPRGSVQLTVPTAQFGDVATWLSINRDDLTIFAHASTGDDLADHSRNVIWFGTSEPLNLAIFGQG